MGFIKGELTQTVSLRGSKDDCFEKDRKLFVKNFVFSLSFL